MKDQTKFDQNKDEYAHLASILENTDDIICSRNLNDELVYFNSAFKKICRELFNTDASFGLNTLVLLPQKERMRWKEIIGKVKQGEFYNGDFTWDFGHKDIRYYSISFNPIRQYGKIIGYSEFTRDITQIKKQENLITAIVSNTPGSLWVIDKNYRFVYGNRLFIDDYKTAFGKHPEESDTLFELVADVDRNTWKSYYDRAFKGESFIERLQRKHIRKGKWYNCHVQPVIEEDGNIRNILLMCFEEK